MVTMTLLSVLLLSIAATSEYALGGAVPNVIKNKVEPFILGGQDAKKGEFPHQVLLKRENGYIHGASIISEDWILTSVSSSHDPASITVVAGQLKLDETDGTEQERKIVQVIEHPLHNPDGWSPKYEYNVALVKVDKKFEFNDNVQPISLLPPGVEVPLGRGLVTGWGSTKDIESEYSNQLQKLNVTLHDVQLCVDAYESIDGFDFSEIMICATGSLDGDADICKGDLGGPLLTLEKEKLYQVGVLSFTMLPCGSAGFPSGYVNVANVIDWIREHVPELE